MFLRSYIHGFWSISAKWAYKRRDQLATTTQFIAIVGSSGKTTTRKAVHTALGPDAAPFNYKNFQMGFIENMRLIKPKHKFAVMEVGIGAPGQMKEHAQTLRPDTVVVTSIGTEHNRSLKTLEVTREEKSQMVQVLTEKNTAILNGDDPNVMWMKEKTKAKIITVGIDPKHDVYATNIQLNWPHGMKFTMHHEGKEYEIQTELLGHHMVYTYLFAFTVAWLEKLPISTILSNLENLKAEPGRMEKFTLPNGVHLISDDYKGSYDSFLSAMDFLETIPTKRLFVVMGKVHEPPGKQGPMYREFGDRFGKMTHKMYFVGDDNQKKVRAGMTSVGFDAKNFVFYGRKIDGLAQTLKEELQKDDVLFIKGTSTQRFRRITLGLLGGKVNCNAVYCNALMPHCEDCPLLSEKDVLSIKNMHVKQLIRDSF